MLYRLPPRPYPEAALRVETLLADFRRRCLGIAPLRELPKPRRKSKPLMNDEQRREIGLSEGKARVVAEEHGLSERYVRYLRSQYRGHRSPQEPSEAL